MTPTEIQVLHWQKEVTRQEYERNMNAFRKQLKREGLELTRTEVKTR